MSPRTRHDYSTLLIWAAALITTVRYAAAFAVSDAGFITGTWSEVLTFFMSLTGIGMGLLDVIGGTYLFDGWRRSMPRTGQAWTLKFKLQTAFVFGLIFTGLVILIPFTVSRVSHQEMATVLAGQSLWWWSGAVNIAPYLLIGGAVIGNVGLVSVTQDEIPQTPSTTDKKPKIDGNWRTFRQKLSKEEMRWIASASISQIMNQYQVSRETATNWNGYAKRDYARIFGGTK